MQGIGSLSHIAYLGEFTNKRASSWDRSGGNKDWIVIPPGGTEILLAEQHAGCVRHFYWTYIEAEEIPRLNIFRGLVLRAFWDNARTPSLEIPLGDFFGSGVGINAFKGWYRVVKEDGTITCYWVMPYKESCVMKIKNVGGAAVEIRDPSVCLFVRDADINAMLSQQPPPGRR